MKTKDSLSEADHALVNEVFSPEVRRKISHGTITAEHKDLRRLERMSPVERETVDDVLCTGDVKDVGVAIDVVGAKPKRKEKSVDVDKLRTKIVDTFGALVRMVDDLGIAIGKSVEETQAALKIAQGNLP